MIGEGESSGPIFGSYSSAECFQKGLCISVGNRLNGYFLKGLGFFYRESFCLFCRSVARREGIARIGGDIHYAPAFNGGIVFKWAVGVNISLGISVIPGF